MYEDLKSRIADAESLAGHIIDGQLNLMDKFLAVWDELVGISTDLAIEISSACAYVKMGAIAQQEAVKRLRALVGGLLDADKSVSQTSDTERAQSDTE